MGFIYNPHLIYNNGNTWGITVSTTLEMLSMAKSLQLGISDGESLLEWG